MGRQELRVAAYGICLSQERVLLAHFVSPDGSIRHWTLPGGGIEHCEDPYHAVVREVREETGYDVVVERLLGVYSRALPAADRIDAAGSDLHTLAVFYRVRVAGGTLRNEVGGSTDLADWVPVAEVPKLERAVIIDVALQLARELPGDGHVEPLPVHGLLH